MAQLIQRGLIDFIGATESRLYKDKTYLTRILIIEQPSFDQYTGEKKNSNYIKFEATREETCKSLDSFQVGNKVDVEFVVRGSKYAKKDGTGDDVFTHLELRSINVVAAKDSQAAPAGAKPLPAAAPAPAPAAAPVPQGAQEQKDYDDELGF